MENSPPRLRRLTLFVDQLTVAAEAIAFGSTSESHWQTLMAFAEREGINVIAERLAPGTRAPRDRGPTREWWRCMLLLGTRLSAAQALSIAHELDHIEANGGGPIFSRDRHAVQVTRAIEFLEEHLRRVQLGAAKVDQLRGVEEVIRSVRRVRGREAGT